MLEASPGAARRLRKSMPRPRRTQLILIAEEFTAEAWRASGGHVPPYMAKRLRKLRRHARTGDPNAFWRALALLTVPPRPRPPVVARSVVEMLRSFRPAIRPWGRPRRSFTEAALPRANARSRAPRRARRSTTRASRAPAASSTTSDDPEPAVAPAALRSAVPA
jgi:hypothetical protein